jgi:hypothetical protein
MQVPSLMLSVSRLQERTMIDNNPTNVDAAFEILLEEIEAEIDLINRVGARAFQVRDYDKAKEALERAAQVTSFRDKADALRREWGNLFACDGEEEDAEAHAERRNLGRLRRGLRTRQEAYYRPILEALESLGGSAPVTEVLDHVLQSMKGVLKDVDYEPLASLPDVPRWKNTAQWARNAMVKEGLLRSDSPRGVQHLHAAGGRLLRGEAAATRSLPRPGPHDGSSGFNGCSGAAAGEPRRSMRWR